MKPLLVTSYFDIGRGSWENLSRSKEKYFSYYHKYLAKLPSPRYLLADAADCERLSETLSFFDASEFGALPCQAFAERTGEVIRSPQFRSYFRTEDDAYHCEHIDADYNLMMMAKWDALERAFAKTEGRFSHYVWIDFGIGHGGGYLPAPIGFSPVERDQIVLSAQHRKPPLVGPQDLKRNIQNFEENAAGTMMIVPAKLLPAYCNMARANYQRLLDMGLTTDDQIVIDMCTAERPDMFYLSQPQDGFSKFNHLHNIINGLDKRQPRKRWRIPLYSKFMRRRRARLFRAQLQQQEEN